MWQSTSNGVAAAAAMHGMANQTMAFKQLLDDAKAWKPYGYDAQIALRRDYYAGEQTKHLRHHLARRYPKTHAKMQPVVVNVFQHVVDQIAAVYRAAPRRELYAGDVRSDEASKALAHLYAEAMVDSKLRRVEQIAAACKLAFVRIGWDEYDERLELTPFWPDAVNVVLHPDYPSRIDRAYALIAQLSPVDGLDSRDKRYEVWTRLDAGWVRNVVAGASSFDLREQTGELHERLPWVAIPYEAPDGCLFALPPGDDVATQDAVNSMYTSLNYTIEMQAFTQLTFSGAQPPADLVAGPGTCLIAGDGGTFGTIAYSPQIDAVKNAAEDLVGRLLVLRGVSPSSASVNPTYQSGVSLKVQNAPMLEARTARTSVYRDMEQRHLWPVCRDVHNAHASTQLPADLAMRWTAGEMMLPLDDQEEFRLSQGRVADSVSTWPHEMVRLRLSENLDVARTQYADALEFNKDHPMVAGIPFIKSAAEAPRMIIEDGDDDAAEE